MENEIMKCLLIHAEPSNPSMDNSYWKRIRILHDVNKNLINFTCGDIITLWNTVLLLTKQKSVSSDGTSRLLTSNVGILSSFPPSVYISLGLKMCLFKNFSILHNVFAVFVTLDEYNFFYSLRNKPVIKERSRHV